VQRRELEHAAALFNSIEINGSFYSLQRPSSYARWRAQTPDGTTFAVKGGRYITHMKRLAGAEAALANFFASGVLALGPKLGPVLWQLPPSLAFDAARLEAFFDLLPRTTVDAAELARRHDDKLSGDRTFTQTEKDLPMRHCLEVRHDTFATEEAVALLRKHDIGLVVADTAGRWPMVEQVTSDFVYVRLHGAEELYVSGYTPESLDAWARKLLRWHAAGLDTYVYFDNDVKVRAPYDALALMQRCGVRSPGGEGLGVPVAAEDAQ
jgi:uncharacterized protein YecE (DUF72 family)